MIDTTKLEQITKLERGAHEDGAAMCAMEAVAWLAGEPWSDAPQCASPVIARFMRTWNDALPDADRTRLLLPLLPDVIGTRTTAADEETRAWMTLDWLVREYTPAWFDCTPSLAASAEALRALPPIMSSAVAADNQSVIIAAGAAARDAERDAAWDAAGVAAWDAARDAAGVAARDAAGDAAGVAARDAAWVAARAAAWSAAGAAAWAAAVDAIKPTVVTLQASAQELVRRMCAVGRHGEGDA
jgi:hypothetical protein